VRYRRTCLILGISNKGNAEVFMKKSRSTIVDWYNLCRNVAIAEFQKRKKMESPGLVVQINESLFQSKRKHNRGR